MSSLTLLYIYSTKTINFYEYNQHVTSKFQTFQHNRIKHPCHSKIIAPTNKSTTKRNKRISSISINQGQIKRSKNKTRWWENEKRGNTATYREETRGVDGEERDLINLGAKESKLWVGGGERKTVVTGRELKGLVEEERIPRAEGNAKSEAIRSLNLGVSTRLVHAVGVGGNNNNYYQWQHHQPQCPF